jgi:hypothetical protein
MWRREPPHRKPSYCRKQFDKMQNMLGQQAVGIAQVAQETGSTWQTVYRIKQRALVLRKLLAPCSLESERCKLTAAPIALV